ncbi:MAG: M48 family metallopeptidase [Gammaproteobacteria bacterium]
MQRFVQLALDFLAGPDPVPREPAQTSRDTNRRADKVAAVPLADALEPAVWQHPRANRQLRLGGCEVAYEFKRGKRRTIGLSVRPEGLTVSAPRWTPVGEVETLLRDRSDWVLEKLRETRQRSQALDQARIVWSDGVAFDFLGEQVRLLLDPAHAFAAAGGSLERTTDGGGMPVLRLGLPHSADESRIRDAAQAWLMRQAQSLFSQRLDHFAPQLGVRHTRLRLSSAGTRWGSASVDGSIRLNWRLIHLSMDLIDYVVVHELSHLLHMDHSPRFWAVVAGVMPDHAERRRALKRVAVPLGD